MANSPESQNETILITFWTVKKRWLSVMEFVEKTAQNRGLYSELTRQWAAPGSND
jgi:hypothetical protein